MKVYVIMSNDYPARVYKTEAAADKFVEEQTALEKVEEAKPINQRARGRIYWRSYEFKLENGK